MVHPQKWRETCDPFALAYQSFQPTVVIGYPHARNDVFHTRGIYKDEEITAYIKVARHKDSAIGNEVSILSQLDDSIFPKVLDADFADGIFSVMMSGSANYDWQWVGLTLSYPYQGE